MNLEAFTKQYKARKQAAERAVVRREWATGPLYSLEPDDGGKERAKARQLPKASTKRGTHEFGFDETGRLCLIRRYESRRGNAYETFIEWRANKATAVGYDYDPRFKAAMTVGVLTHRGGQPVRYNHRYRGGSVVIRYEYRGGRLANLRIKIPGKPEELRHVKASAPPAPVPKAAVKAQLAKIEEVLVAKIPDAVRKAPRPARSPFWCLGLVFDRSIPQLPPDLALATVAERAELPRTKRWDCAAWDGVNAAWVPDRRLDSACEAVTKQLGEDGGRLVSALVVRVARRLNALPRARFGDVDDAFVVFAFDRDRPAKALLAESLTPRQRTML